MPSVTTSDFPVYAVEFSVSVNSTSTEPNKLTTNVNFTKWLAIISASFLSALLASAQSNTPSKSDFSPTSNVRTLTLPSDVNAAFQAFPDARVAAATKEGIPTFLRGLIDTIKRPADRSFAHADAAPTIRKIAALFRLDPNDLVPAKTATDHLGLTHINYDQTHNGLPVVGTRLSVHVKPDGTVYAVTGNAHGDKTVPRVAKVFPDSAVATVQAFVHSPKTTSTHRRLVYVVSTNDQKMYLAHEIVVRGANDDGSPVSEFVYVNALTGAIVDVHDLVFNSESITIYDAATTATFRYGSAVRTETSGPATSPSGANGATLYNTNFDDIADTYLFYYSSANFGRDSVDGFGATFYSTVNYGENYSNSGFSVSIDTSGNISDNNLFFGDGDGTTFGNFANALDVTAHEIAQGMVFYTSSLIYANEPGAINEAMGDILGVTCKAWIDKGQSWTSYDSLPSDTWKYGKDTIVSSSYSAQRRFDVPHTYSPPAPNYTNADYYPDTLSYALGPGDIPVPGISGSGNDNGWLHYNCTIADLAFYLMVKGGQHPRAGGSIPTTTVPALDSHNYEAMHKAASIFYQANLYYLGPGAQFMDLREATFQAASDLYGSTAATDVAIAWDVVGVPTFSNREPVNMSSRGYVGVDDQVMIAGLVLSGGSTAKTLLLRGVGPALYTQFGLYGTLSNTELTLRNALSNTIGYNSGWSNNYNASAIASAASSVGAFALEDQSLDSALLPALSSGVYTMTLDGPDLGEGSPRGLGMVEVYDTDTAHSNPNHLVNLSTRAWVGTGQNVLIGGFVIVGTGNKTLLIRGIGPELSSNFNLSGTLLHAQIDLKSGGTTIRTNNDWTIDENGGAQWPWIIQAGTKVGAFALNFGYTNINYHDAALVVTLPAGVYSVILTGVGSTTGLGMIEIYEVP